MSDQISETVVPVYEIEQTIVPGEWMVTDQSDPTCSNIVFDGPLLACWEWIAAHA